MNVSMQHKSVTANATILPTKIVYVRNCFNTVTWSQSQFQRKSRWETVNIFNYLVAALGSNISS